MKAIVYRGAQLLRLLDAGSLDSSKLFTDHKLSRLLPSVKTMLEQSGWTCEPGAAGLNSFDDFKALVQQIEDLDRDSYNFRYPTNRKGESALNHHTVINPIAFALNMDPILELLDAGVLGLHEEFDATAEAKAEFLEIVKQVGVQSDFFND